MGQKARERREAQEVSHLIKRGSFLDYVRSRAEEAFLKNRVIWSEQARDGIYPSDNDPRIDPFPIALAGVFDDAVVIDASELTLPFSARWEERVASYGEVFDEESDRISGVWEFPLVVPDRHVWVEWLGGKYRFGVDLTAVEVREDRRIRIDRTYKTVFVDYACEAKAYWGSGSYIDWFPIDFNIFENQWDDGKDAWDLIHVCVDFALYVFKLMSAKNVILVDNVPNPDMSLAYQRRLGVPMKKYKTLALRGESRQNKNDCPQKQFNVLSMHSVRAHTRYAPDHPIPQFAKPMLIHAHMRGNPDNGVVVKDYKVMPPDEGA